MKPKDMTPREAVAAHSILSKEHSLTARVEATGTPVIRIERHEGSQVHPHTQ